MKRYVRPMMDAQMFVINEYVAACFSVACQVANSTRNPVDGTVWSIVEWETQTPYHIVSHTTGEGTCGSSASNYITTGDNNTITSIAELNAEQGRFLYGKITGYSDLNGDKIVNEGDYVSWTTTCSWAQGDKGWHHWGYLVASDKKHPNHS